ncbi:MAG TPA: hypothetical protein VE643_01350 [Nitrososphaeraceae archaeon]|nr:hypothetical protein [Nitrososphaeraceae archaeon]
MFALWCEALNYGMISGGKNGSTNRCYQNARTKTSRDVCDAFDVVISVSGVAGTDKLVPQLWQNFAVPV